MKYQNGKQGRVFVVRFEDGDDVIGGLVDIAKKESVKAGIVHMVGGMREGDIVVGPASEEMPPKPVWRSLGESHEVLGFGTIFWQGDEPKIHLHGAFGKKETVKMGCLRRNSETFLVLEAIIIEIEGIDAKRELDPVSGMVLLKI